MTESTSNHNWTIPEVGGSKDVWGQILNDFFDDELDEEVSLKGPFSDRPSAGSGVAKLYLATDRRIVYYNNGTSWEAVYGLGTEDNPVPDTSHFESIQAGSVSTEEADTRGPYQDKLSERSKDTWFQADQGVIEVGVIWGFDSTNRTQLAVSVNNEQTRNRINSNIQDTPDPEDQYSVSFTVPDGSYYRIEESGDTVTLESWQETTRND